MAYLSLQEQERLPAAEAVKNNQLKKL